MVDATGLIFHTARWPRFDLMTATITNSHRPVICRRYFILFPLPIFPPRCDLDPTKRKTLPQRKSGWRALGHAAKTELTGRYSGWDGLPSCILVYWYPGEGSIGKTLEEVDPQSYDIRLKMEISIFAIHGRYYCTSTTSPAVIGHRRVGAKARFSPSVSQCCQLRAAAVHMTGSH